MISHKNMSLYSKLCGRIGCPYTRKLACFAYKDISNVNGVLL